MVCCWCRQFTAGQQHVHDESSGRPSIITDDLLELVQEHIMEDRHFTIMELGSHFLLPVAQNYHGALVPQKIECHSNRHQNTKQSTGRSNTMMMAMSFWIISLQVMKRGLNTLTQEQSSSQCIGITVDLPAGLKSSRLCQRGK